MLFRAAECYSTWPPGSWGAIRAMILWRVFGICG